MLRLTVRRSMQCRFYNVKGNPIFPNHYPKFDNTQHWTKRPTKELSAALVEAFKGNSKTDD